MAVGRKYKGVGGPWRVEWPLTLVPCVEQRLDRLAKSERRADASLRQTKNAPGRFKSVRTQIQLKPCPGQSLPPTDIPWAESEKLPQ